MLFLLKKKYCELSCCTIAITLLISSGLALNLKLKFNLVNTVKICLKFRSEFEESFPSFFQLNIENFKNS